MQSHILAAGGHPHHLAIGIQYAHFDNIGAAFARAGRVGIEGEIRWAGAHRRWRDRLQLSAGAIAAGILGHRLALGDAIAAAHFAGIAKALDRALVQPQHLVAQPHHRLAVMGDEQEGAAFAEMVQEPHAFLLEGDIAHRQYFVHDQDIGIDMG